MSASSTDLPRKSRPGKLVALVIIGTLLIASGVWLRQQLRPVPEDGFGGAASTSRLMESEGLILDLTPKLKEALNTSVLNLQLPDALGVELFAKDVEWSDIAESDTELSKELHQLGIRKFTWSISEKAHSGVSSEFSLWRPFIDSVDYFERAGFKFVRSHFDSDAPNILVSDVTFEGLARDHDGGYVLVKADQEVRWQPQPDVDHAKSGEEPVEAGPVTSDDWRIISWHQTSFQTVHAERLLFEESLDQIIPDEALRKRLRNSKHEGYILDRYAALKKHDEWEGPHPYFSVVSQDRHPSISVVDIDRDGLDDLYVMSRWEPNVLLHNKGGYFEDVAPQYGLDIDSHCASAIFADFDNDGDSDLLLGRTLVPSQYLVNEGGHFVDRTKELVEGGLPALVTSVSAADYNGDGLLDVYLSTYAANMQHDEIRGEGPVPDRIDQALLEDFLPEEIAAGLHKKLSQRDYRRYLNNYGPPNVLLVNRGDGRLEPAPENEQVGVWRHTYQASWSDFDRDGDQDLYIANDFAVNSLMRNDGADGFVDVAAVTETTDIGFGMGAAWGDYDNDGLADLYVSNMFSKAGRRITGSLENIDERFGMMARGNSLFRNQPDRFAKVSGLEAPALQVEKAGWSWSGQFVDFDNDGWLDVHALSGYYTAPPEVAVKVDL